MAAPFSWSRHAHPVRACAKFNGIGAAVCLLRQRGILPGGLVHAGDRLLDLPDQ
ncbi:MAG TPA: hypothetical protein VGP06_15295 [Janthinobacterium sp.]|jgi:hypothetical protein|nr:hypothetical protein [Janthinobacterium sp.]